MRYVYVQMIKLLLNSLGAILDLSKTSKRRSINMLQKGFMH